jgi:hypothetical protein
MAQPNSGGMLPYFVPPPPAPGDMFHYLRLRNALPAGSPLQAVLGPLEHGQFVEDAVRSNPLSALPLMLAIPGYTAAKATGLIDNTRSPASWDEMFAAYRGMLRGLQPPEAPSPGMLLTAGNPQDELDALIRKQPAAPAPAPETPAKPLAPKVPDRVKPGTAIRQNAEDYDAALRESRQQEEIRRRNAGRK